MLTKPGEPLVIKRKDKRFHITTSIRMRVELLQAIQSLADKDLCANEVMIQILTWGVKAQGKELQMEEAK